MMLVGCIGRGIDSKSPGATQTQNLVDLIQHILSGCWVMGFVKVLIVLVLVGLKSVIVAYVVVEALCLFVLVCTV